jgi:hypothetical protein
VDFKGQGERVDAEKEDEERKAEGLEGASGQSGATALVGRALDSGPCQFTRRGKPGTGPRANECGAFDDAGPGFYSWKPGMTPADS